MYRCEFGLSVLCCTDLKRSVGKRKVVQTQRATKSKADEKLSTCRLPCPMSSRVIDRIEKDTIMFLDTDPWFPKGELFTPVRFSPTFGYTKEKPPHNVGSWFRVRRLVGGDLWETSLGDVSWERGRGRPYYSSGPSPRGGLGGRLPRGSRWACLPERVWGCCYIVWGG